MSLGSRAVKRAASEALAGFTEDGIYPPGLGDQHREADPGTGVAPVRRVRRPRGHRGHLRYEGAEHALLVAIDLAELPTVGMIAIGEDADGMLKDLRDEAEPHERYEQITLAEARRRIEARSPGPARTRTSTATIPRSCSCRWPGPGSGGCRRRIPARVYTAADRAAAVDGVPRQPGGRRGRRSGGRPVLGPVLTGYSSRVPDEPPAQVGPHKLAAMLLVHVAEHVHAHGRAARRDGQAVTAWARWAAARQGLDEAATEHW